MLEAFVFGCKGHYDAEYKAHKGNCKQHSEPEKLGGADRLVFGIGSIFEESKADPVDGPVVPQIEGFKIGRYGRYFPSVR